jgi:hypothetical protein
MSVLVNLTNQLPKSRSFTDSALRLPSLQADIGDDERSGEVILRVLPSLVLGDITISNLATKTLQPNLG